MKTFKQFIETQGVVGPDYSGFDGTGVPDGGDAVDPNVQMAASWGTRPRWHNPNDNSQLIEKLTKGIYQLTDELADLRDHHALGEILASLQQAIATAKEAHAYVNKLSMDNPS